MTHVLIVEDEIPIAEVLIAYLKNERISSHHIDCGAGVLEYVQQQAVDLVLLDLMLPDSCGLELCKKIRSFSNIPIIMLTAKVEEIDRLIGLELGADDYICKPFSAREVVARVKTVLRRAKPDLNKFTVVGKLSLNPDQYKCCYEDQELDLTPTEFKLLNLFAEKPEHVFSREMLLQHLSEQGTQGSERAIDSHIKNIRKKIEKVCHNADWIQAVYGVGYRLVKQE
ncbi:MAG: response regulator [Alteromonadales bacterium]|nr:response regulator [Alteromonadales bacterium]